MDRQRSKSLVASLINGGLRNITKFVSALRQGNKSAWIGAAVAVAIAIWRLSRKREEAKPMLVFDQIQTERKDRWDVCIVGAGPSGSTCAFHLAKAGLRVLLLEKKKFPRDKHCGDAVCLMAQRHLKEMGVLQEIIAEGAGHYQSIGGFVSPNGSSFIGNSAAEMPDKEYAGLVIAIKRIIMDNKIAMAAKRQGAALTELTTAESFDYDPTDGGWWTVHCTATPDGEGTAEQKISYTARILVCADGAPSQSARKLGIVKTAPQGTCSRAYVKPGTHNFKADGVVFFPKQLLPGYAAIMRHPNGELNFCTYIIPGGKAKNEDLHDIHYGLIKDDPYVSKALGPKADIETMRPGSLRLGGEARTSGNHVIVIGDAAGLIDPLTGEGIHFALASGKMSAQAIIAAFSAGNFSSGFLKQKWDDRWQKEWGSEFYWSMKICLIFYYFPGLLDAAAKVIKRKGADFLLQWGMMMTGEKSKMWFLRPDIGPAIGLQYLIDSIRGSK